MRSWRVCGIEPGSAALTTALTVLLAGCSGEAQPAASARSGVAHGAELDLRIDGNEADLVPITWLGVSPTGRIALIQLQDGNVRFFDAAGTPLGAVGRSGEGPGEFRRPLRGGWIGDTLWVSDTQLNRITLIGPDLEVAGTLTPPMEVGAPGISETRYGLNTPYGVLARNELIVMPGTMDGPGGDPDAGPPLLRVTSDGRLINEIVSLPRDENAGGSIDLGDRVLYYRVPFRVGHVWSVAADGQLIALLTHEGDAGQNRFRVHAFGSDGGERFDRSFPFEPVPIPQAAIDSAIAAITERQPAGVRRQFESALRESAPSHYAGAERLVVGQDHRVWVGLLPKDDGQTWIALNDIGEPVDTVILPDRVTLHAASATHLWAVERDGFDVESVVRYRLAEDAH